MTIKRYPLPKRFNAALSEKAYTKLRTLNSQYGYGNNYLLTIILENLEEIVNKDKLETVFEDFKEQYGKPAPGDMKKKS